MQGKIAILLPYKDQFIKDNAGSASIWVKDFSKNSIYKKNTTVFGFTNYTNKNFGVYPKTKWVRNTNKALLSVQVDKRTGRVVIMSVIDNLLKGQTGQAIQNLNLLSGFSMDEGLELTNNYP